MGHLSRRHKTSQFIAAIIYYTLYAWDVRPSTSFYTKYQQFVFQVQFRFKLIQFNELFGTKNSLARDSFSVGARFCRCQSYYFCLHSKNHLLIDWWHFIHLPWILPFSILYLYIKSIKSHQFHQTKSNKTKIEAIQRDIPSRLGKHAVCFLSIRSLHLDHFNTIHFPVQVASDSKTEWENHVKRQVENWTWMPLLNAVCTGITSNGSNTTFMAATKEHSHFAINWFVVTKMENEMM